MCNKARRLHKSESLSLSVTLSLPRNEEALVSSASMRWLRLVGSINLYVSFAKEPYKKDNILQKRHNLSILLTVATP